MNKKELKEVLEERIKTHMLDMKNVGGLKKDLELSLLILAWAKIDCYI